MPLQNYPATHINSCLKQHMTQTNSTIQIRCCNTTLMTHTKVTTPWLVTTLPTLSLSLDHTVEFINIVTKDTVNICPCTKFNIQNIKLQHITGIKGSTSHHSRYWATVFTNSEKWNEEMLKQNWAGQASKKSTKQTKFICLTRWTEKVRIEWMGNARKLRLQPDKLVPAHYMTNTFNINCQLGLLN